MKAVESRGLSDDLPASAPASVCVACDGEDATAGVLCGACSSQLCATALCPEQIVSGVVGAAEAALADRWGRLHSLAANVTAIGRNPGGLTILEPSVSRQHALIERVRPGEYEVWDRESSNGTFVNGVRISGRHVLARSDRVSFGDVAFLFVPRRPRASEPFASPPALFDDDPPSSSDDGETFSGLWEAKGLVLVEHSGGAGGVLEIGSNAVQLTLIQYELFSVLRDRMTAEAGRDERVRGFVRSSELLALLPWDSSRADENHLKQLIRRARRTLARVGLGEIIEARHGFGYRLRIRIGGPGEPRGAS